MTALRQRLAQHLGHIARKITHPDRVQIEPPLRNPAALCVASDDVLVCADDERRAIFQVTLEKDGVTIRGKSLKLVDYPDVAAIESLAVCGQLVYFVSAKGPRTVGGLYSFNLAGGPVDVLLKTNSCSEIKCVASSKNILAFTDSRAYQVKVYDPVDMVVTVLVGSGQRGNEDGTAKSSTFVQPHGICTVGETIFVTDVATGNVKLITELSGTTQFLKHLGLFNN